ncbi:hypothetical protein PR202_gb15019 [Eleusine coracana subsp. coracana]|uniref:Trafficking protein particle complex subunit n=1 Tax=Eleusine coracana subsp. coracana TaxID=191504 RepID=A0AAV5EUK4_ELECO|nr:hypothetical protein PR202_gb15019 [Eleusine coracana subsp. coracana]
MHQTDHLGLRVAPPPRRRDLVGSSPPKSTWHRRRRISTEARSCRGRRTARRAEALPQSQLAYRRRRRLEDPAMPPLTPKSGDALFASVDRVNAELFTLTYGAMVRQLLTDLEEVEEVNKQLDQMHFQTRTKSFQLCFSPIWDVLLGYGVKGYNIGTRLVDEFLAKSNVSRCVDFKETADVIAKVFAFLTLGFKMFLGVAANVTNWDAEGLHYCNVLSGVIRGALEMVSMKTEVTWVRDMLRGDDAYEMRVKLIKQVPEEYPYKDDD